ncbi:DUF669 domain-containing protein [Lactiplantibacillus herbarum]|uniref:DUF669 domain-containing protein n=1 Tax=Lactiplantibacillus herbarum TaxID=1670446 RepID=UPI00064F4942|nr:DUF669 domain-containing protein [Lactiplantibacillus herbarum]
MALFTVDSSNTFGQSVEEAGKYNVVIASSSQYKQSQSTNKPMAVFDYEVLDGQYKGGMIRFDNEIWDGTTEDKAKLSAKRFSTIAVALGAQNGSAFDSIEQFVNQAVGNKLAITVDWEVGNNGKIYLTVKGYEPYMQDGSKPNGVRRPEGQQGGSSTGGFGSQSSSGFGSNQNSSNSGFGAPSGQPSGGFGNQSGNTGTTTNNPRSEYNGGQPFDQVPNGMPF